MNDDLEAIDGLCAKIIEQRDRIWALEAALRAVIVRCEEGDKKSDWLPTISNIARAALADAA